MDIKLKKFKNKYLATVVVLIIALTASIAVISTYSDIKKEADKIEYNPYDDSQFLNTIYSSNYVLYQNILEKKTGEMISPSDILLSEKIIEYLVEKEYNSNNYYNEYDQYDEARSKEEYINNIKYEFNNQFRIWQSNLLSLQNLEYYAIDKDSKTDVSNTTESLRLFYKSHIKEEVSNAENNDGNNQSNADEGYNKEELETLKKDYNFYAVIDYDSEGNANILESFGIEQKILEKLFIEKNQNVDKTKIEQIKNMTVVYAVPNVLQYQDDIYWNIKNQDRYIYGYSNITYTIVFLISLGFAISALLFPYKSSKNLVGFESIAKIPFEIISIFTMVVCGLMYENSSNIIRQSVTGGFFETLTSNSIGVNLANIAISFVNIAYWLVYFLILFIGITLIKHIFKVGLKKYFMSKTITGIILIKVINSIKKWMRYLKETDFKEKPNKTILIVVLINFVILTVMSSLWFFGILLAIVYTVVSFVLIRKYYTKLLDKYNKLLQYTNQIADGDLNADIDEDLGIFEPVKEKLGSIQTGFKKAVEEEVKSQSMKTELISNVSHDLKTPLTSIITYVDLLKDESINEDKRKHYIDTLEKKSQRLKVLIEDLFEMSKASSGNINLNIVDIDIVSLMKQTLLELNDQTSSSGLIFKNNFPENKVMLPLDSQRTFRIFENLIINISKYSMQNSRVYIDIIEEEDRVNIILKNMSAVEIDFNVNDIVERFVRGDKSRNTEGSGLGLAIAKSFVELQNGKFSIDVDGDLFKVTIIFYKKW